MKKPAQKRDVNQNAKAVVDRLLGEEIQNSSLPKKKVTAKKKPH